MKSKLFIHKILLGILPLLILSGCYDLDRDSKNQLGPNTFWKTDEHAKQAIMPCYLAMKHDEVYYKFFAMDCISDVASGYDPAGYWDISRGTWDQGSGYASGRWSQTYEGIARTNIVIRNISVSETISPEVKTVVVAEAKFLRALFYFFLMNHFGGVPIYDETTDYNRDYMEMTKPRNTEEETRQFILKDLEAALVDLPVAWKKEEYGRATTGAVYGLRAKVYLYNKEYDLARKDFEEIVLDPSAKGYNYKLHPSYAELFTPVADASNEMVFAIQNFANGSYYLGMPFAWYMGTNSSVGASWNNVLGSVKLADQYELKDGKPFNWDDFIPGFNNSTAIREKTFLATLDSDNNNATVKAYPQYYNELLAMYEQRDPRMKETLILPYTHYLGYVGGKDKLCEYVIATGITTTNGFVVVNRGYKLYPFRKFVPEGLMGGTITPNSRGHIPINFPIIRYADVLLMLAECYNELGRVDDAVTYINMVRQRASTNLPALNSGSAWLEARSQKDVFERIKNERAVEFPVEGLRYYDLKRWGIIETIQNDDELDFLGTTIYKNKFEKKDYLWPIPLSEIDMNPKLKQNPGWS